MNPGKCSFVVRGLRLEADAVLAVELAPADGTPSPTWEAGSHIDLVVGDGSSRQYSLCGTPGAPSWRVAVLQEDSGRGGSRWVHEVLRPGQRVEVGGPRNHFALEDASSYVFVAGGVGITPLLPMMASATEAGADWILHYYGRSRSSMAFVEELSRYGDRVKLHPGDGSARRPDAAELLADVRPGTFVYACGPRRLLDTLDSAAADGGWDAQLRTELFTAPGADPDAPSPDSFDVLLESSGRELHVPADRSLLSVLVDAGIDMVSDCEEGICGSCETRVLAGTIDHRDHVLTPQEREIGDCMMVCVSRAAGPRLTLDL